VLPETVFTAQGYCNPTIMSYSVLALRAPSLTTTEWSPESAAITSGSCPAIIFSFSSMSIFSVNVLLP
jgi:hypothetical protein